MFEGTSKQSRDPKNSNTTPPFEIPRSATAKIIIYTQFVINIFGNIFLNYRFTGRIKD